MNGENSRDLLILARVRQAEADGFYKGTEAASAELLRLQDVIRTGGAMYRAERASMGIPAGHDPHQTAEAEVECLRKERDALRNLVDAAPPMLGAHFAALIAFYRDDERRAIAAWLQFQADMFDKQGDSDEAGAFHGAAFQVAKGAKMIGPGASALSAKAMRSGTVEGIGGTGGVISEEALRAADDRKAE